MFEHSVKVPRHYKVATNIFRKVSTEGASVKTLLYDDKLRHHRVNVLYALVTETIKHSADLDKIFSYTKLFEKEPRLDPWLTKILTTELLFGKKILPGESKPVQTVLSYKNDFESYLLENQHQIKAIKVTRKPRYVRVNTILLSTSDAIQAFQSEGYQFIRCPSESYADYLNLINGLSEWSFTQDFHVKTILVFAAGTKLYNNELYLENKIILQDKATALPVHLLAPPPDSIVLDMCAAPGMKTTQVTAYMRNTGKVYAVERDSKRCETLREFLRQTGCNTVEVSNADVLEVVKGQMSDVEYIILDPSCSGSGMDHALYDYREDKERLQKLTSLQEKLLKHAMNSFPNAKRIVYSTCSLHPEENERVVMNVVKASRAKWNIMDASEMLNCQWNNKGSGMYGSFGTRCIYARPELDFTIGFFIAVLERKESDRLPVEKKENDKERREEKNEIAYEKSETNLSRCDGSEEYLKKSKKKKKHGNHEKDDPVPTVTEDDEQTPEIIEKKKHGKRKNLSEIARISDSDSDNNTKSIKRRKKGEDSESIGIINDDLLNQDAGCDSEKLQKKKKKNRAKESLQSEVEVCMEETFKKKKKKNILEDPLKFDEDFIPEVEVAMDETSKKKKKEKKSKELLKCDEDITAEVEVDMSKTFKKKKKEQKSNEAMKSDDGSIAENEVAKDKTLKKKKRKKDLDTTQI